MRTQLVHPVGKGGSTLKKCIFLLVLWASWFPLLGYLAFAENSPAANDDQIIDTTSPLLGRLFNTPINRMLLDRLRLHGPPTEKEKENNEAEQTEEKLPPVIKGPRYVSVTGMVVKERGLQELWLDGKVIPLEATFQGEGYAAYISSASLNGLPISSVDSPEVFLVKPGQTIDFVEKRVRSTWEIPEKERATARREPPATKETNAANNNGEKGDKTTAAMPTSNPAKDGDQPAAASSADKNPNDDDPMKKLSGIQLPPGFENAINSFKTIRAIQQPNKDNPTQ